MVRGRRVLACALACAALARAQTSAAGSSSCLDATYGLAQCVGLDPGELSVYEIYALASALGHHYWVVPSEALGKVHPLEKDLRADIPAIRRLLDHDELRSAAVSA